MTAFSLQAATPESIFAVKTSGLWILVDTAISWLLYGVIFVQMCSYFTLLRTRAGRGRENAWQVWAIAVVWVLSTASTLSTLSRTIRINVSMFGHVDAVDHFHNRPHNLMNFVLGFVTIAVVQISIICRGLAFAKTITPSGKLGWVRESTKWIGSFTHLLWGISGCAAEYYLYQYNTYSEMIKDVSDPNTGVPRFLVFQIIWLVSGLVIALILSFNLCRDVIQARKFNSTDHPNVKLTNEVLYQLLAAVIGNWVYICFAHAAYIFAVTFRRSAIAGRGTLSLAPIYVFSLMRMIAAPRETRSRQLREGQNPNLPQHYDPTHLARPRRKHLFGLGRLSKRKRSSGTTTPTKTSGTGRDMGFFSMLRGGPQQRTTASLATAEQAPATAGLRRRGSGLVDGIRKSTEVLSYSRREKEFYLLEDAVDGPPTDEDAKWVRKNQLLAIGNAVWVETGNVRRPLSANEHYPMPQASASSTPRSPTFTPTSATTSAPGRTLRRLANASTPSAARAHFSRFGSSSAPVRPPPSSAVRDWKPEHAYLGERRAQVSFLDSFPTAPVVSHSYGVYDPDLDDFELPALGLEPVTEPS